METDFVDIKELIDVCVEAAERAGVVIRHVRESGELDAVLARSCSYFENQVERAVTSVTALIQPIILCVIGIAVGVLFYAVYAPLLQVMTDLDTDNQNAVGVVRAAAAFISALR